MNVTLRRLRTALAAVIAAFVLVTVGAASCGQSFQNNIPGPGKCKPGYHHRLVNENPLAPWCVKDGSAP